MSVLFLSGYTTGAASSMQIAPVQLSPSGSSNYDDPDYLFASELSPHPAPSLVLAPIETGFDGNTVFTNVDYLIPTDFPQNNLSPIKISSQSTRPKPEYGYIHGG